MNRAKRTLVKKNRSKFSAVKLKFMTFQTNSLFYKQILCFKDKFPTLKTQIIFLYYFYVLKTVNLFQSREFVF